MAEFKKHAVIVCVETALHALLKTGVQPDFIIITELKPQLTSERSSMRLQKEITNQEM